MFRKIFEVMKGIVVGFPNPIEPVDFVVDLRSDQEKMEGDVALEFYNDDKTSMDFVMNLLESCFHFDKEKSVETMLEIHTKGSVRVEWLDETTANQIIAKVELEAKEYGHPFKASIVRA